MIKPDPIIQVVIDPMESDVPKSSLFEVFLNEPEWQYNHISSSEWIVNVLVFGSESGC